MNVLVIADDELVKGQVPESPADILIACGDLSDDAILEVARQCACRTILAVKGNHDSGGKFPEPIVDLHLRTVEIGGVSFGGFGGSWKYKARGHHLFEQDEVEVALASFPRVDVFVSHNSPRLVHDREDGIHIGFVALSNYIARNRPRYLLHGHQHINEETAIEATQVVGTYGFRRMIIAA